GDLARALEYQKKALELHTELDIKASQAIDLGSMAVVYRSLGNLPEALQCLRESLELNRALKARSYEAKDLKNMGGIYRELGDLSVSLEYCTQALKLYRELGNRVREAETLNETGLVHLESHDYPEALKYFRESLKIAEEIHIPEPIWRCRKNIGDVYAQMNQFGDALQSYRSSIEAIEGVRKKLELEEFKTSYMQTKMEVYEQTVGLLIQMDRKFEAFQYVERAKARALLEMLIESKIDVYQGVDAELLDREREIFIKISSIQTDLQNPDITEEDREDLIRSLREQEESLEYLRLELRRENPQYADLRYPEPYSLEEIQREVLPDGDTVLLEYLLGEARSYLWIVSKTGLEVLSLPPREEIERGVKRVLSIISQPPTQRTFYDLSHRLYNMLVPPDETNLSGVRNLIIVPDGILFYLPFEALVQSKVRGPKVKVSFLGESFDVSYAPSASTLALILKERLKREGQMELLIFGDPDYGEEAIGGLTRESVTKSLYDRYHFPRLRFSGQEAKAIASLYPEEKVRVFLRAQAREEEIKKEELEGYRILHFATHGVLDEVVPRRSGVVLALDEDPVEDGFLQIHEIFNLRLGADIVVLSACQTGLGKLVRGEGMLGLSRAFFYAGASSILASLWSVNDRSTAQLMTHFHQNLKDGMEKREALRKAKLTLLSEGGRLAHPYYWAPFILMGDYR
ncbi:MAG: CHAT domain-containing protein, partial [bacterium]